MISVNELAIKEQEYELVYWKWTKPYYELETSEFTIDGSFEQMRFDTYCELWCDKLNNDDGLENYIVAYKSRPSDINPNGFIYHVNVVKLKED